MKKIYSLIVIALVMASCVAPRVVTQLTPEASDGHYEMGREYISLSNDSIDVELGYDGIHGENLVFDFVVVNRSPGVLSINPSDFYFVLLDSSTADSSKLPPKMALHPERVLFNYDETLEAKSGEKNANTFLGILEAGFGLMANTTAFLATDNPGYIVDAVFSTLGTAGHYVTQDKMISENISMIKEEKDIVKEEIFRLYHLPAGKVVSGYVYFPQNPDPGYYMFCFPVEDQLFQFVYHQQKVYHYY
ncbi:MAG: hypothetical protein KAR19_09360 [Bacteroidales bacterium]|nr:hypothetical protein [Bacteroidales bacterium]